MLAKKKDIIILFFIIVLGATYLLFIFKTNRYIPCLFHKITGLYCPGCGITRMIQAIVRLEFVEAFWYNPLVFCLIPFIGLYLINLIRSNLNKKKLFGDKTRKVFWNVTLVITIAFWVLRNIPALSFLAP